MPRLVFGQNFVSDAKTKRIVASATETRAAVNPRAEVTRTARGLRSATRREHARAFVSVRDEPSSKVASSSRRAEAAEEEAMRARVSGRSVRGRVPIDAARLKRHPFVFRVAVDGARRRSDDRGGGERLCFTEALDGDTTHYRANRNEDDRLSIRARDGAYASFASPATKTAKTQTRRSARPSLFAGGSSSQRAPNPPPLPVPQTPPPLPPPPRASSRRPRLSWRRPRAPRATRRLAPPTANGGVFFCASPAAATAPLLPRKKSPHALPSRGSRDHLCRSHLPKTRHRATANGSPSRGRSARDGPSTRSPSLRRRVEPTL